MQCGVTSSADVFNQLAGLNPKTQSPNSKQNIKSQAPQKGIVGSALPARRGGRLACRLRRLRRNGLAPGE